jgi:hypothetical protein
MDMGNMNGLVDQNIRGVGRMVSFRRKVSMFVKRSKKLTSSNLSQEIT